MSSNVGEPSCDDWGSALHVGVKCVLGILLHNILPNTVQHALPNWDSMTIDEVDDNSDDAAVERIKKQKKAYRTLRVLTSFMYTRFQLRDERPM